MSASSAGGTMCSCKTEGPACWREILQTVRPTTASEQSAQLAWKGSHSPKTDSFATLTTAEISSCSQESASTVCPTSSSAGAGVCLHKLTFPIVWDLTSRVRSASSAEMGSNSMTLTTSVWPETAGSMSSTLESAWPASTGSWMPRDNASLKTVSHSIRRPTCASYAKTVMCSQESSAWLKLTIVSHISGEPAPDAGMDSF